MVPRDPNARPYGRNPYAGYDSATAPFLYSGELPDKLPAMHRVVAVGDEAWDLDLLRAEKRIETKDLVLTWNAGQASALDAGEIGEGRDVGTVTVERKTERGLELARYHVTFAFVFHAFHPDGTWHLKGEAG